jgi:hypothetical protein
MTAEELAEVKEEQRLEQESKRGTFEKKKPGARMIDQFGKIEKRNRAIDIGISDMVLPPITRKTIATYRILGTDQINVSTGQPVEPIDVLIPGTYMFYDRGQTDLTKRNVMMKNTSRPQINKDKASGKNFIDDDLIEDILFVKGVMRVDVEKQYRLYVFLELYPLNKSNRYRNEAVNPLFERIDINVNRSTAFTLAAQDLAYEAETDVIKLEDKDQIRAMATSAGVPTMENGNPRPIAVIKADLRVYARSNPKGFFSIGGGNLKAAIKMQVLDAVSLGLIDVDASRRSFVNPVTSEKSLHVWQVQEDPTDSYVNFLASPEGKDQYESIKNMIDYWNR